VGHPTGITVFHGGSATSRGIPPGRRIVQSQVNPGHLMATSTDARGGHGRVDAP